MKVLLMKQRSAAALFLIASALGAPAIMCGQRLDGEPAHASGQGVTPAFEGWFRNPDGTYSIMVVATSGSLSHSNQITLVVQ